MKTIYTEEHRHQDGKAKLIDGKLLPCFEKPERADVLFVMEGGYAVAAIGVNAVNVLTGFEHAR